MTKTTWMTTTLAALATASALASAPAAASTSVHVRIGPPAPLYEAAQPAQPGLLWVPGHWEWSARGYVWIAGRHMRERPGYAYQQPAHGYGHQHGRGHDRDRDGVPNRYDRDRDGDGVANRHDRQPDNPRWR